MLLEEAKQSIGAKVRYIESNDVIPKRGIGTIISVNSSIVIVQWNKLKNACYPECLELVNTPNE